MRFVSARHGDRRFAGAVIDDAVVPLDGVSELGPATPSSLLRAPSLRRGEGLPLADVELLPVVPNPRKIVSAMPIGQKLIFPRKIVCVGSNYRAHVEEMGRELPGYPVLFTKFASSLIGPYATIVAPPESQQIDFEAEIAVVIGTAGRRIQAAAALDHVAGYAIVNDVSMRDFQYRTHQWLQGKAWEAATPLGPALVTPDEVDIGDLDLRLTLNGEPMQESNTSLLIFDVPTIIERIAEFTTLEVGDVILTGTPDGVGYKRDPQVFLEDGDVVAVEVTGLGRIENRVRRG